MQPKLNMMSASSEEIRHGFIFRREWYSAISRLNKDARCEVYDAIMSKVWHGVAPKGISELAQMALNFIIPQIEQDERKKREICERRRVAGRLGGLAKGNNNNRQETKEESTTNANVTRKEQDDTETFVDYIYSLYPTKCPVRKTSLGKCFKDKERIRRLLKAYSREDIEKVVKREVQTKLGKQYMKNFSTFLNNFPDPNNLFEEQTLELDVENKSVVEQNAPLIIDGQIYR